MGHEYGRGVDVLRCDDAFCVNGHKRFHGTYFLYPRGPGKSKEDLLDPLKLKRRSVTSPTTPLSERLLLLSDSDSLPCLVVPVMIQIYPVQLCFVSSVHFNIIPARTTRSPKFPLRQFLFKRMNSYTGSCRGFTESCISVTISSYCCHTVLFNSSFLQYHLCPFFPSGSSFGPLPL